MKVLLLGASGFIGRHVRMALIAAGHHVVRAQRRVESADDVAIDLTQDVLPEIWRPRLQGVDVVVNAVGVLRDTPKTPMQAIHADAPKALFEACEAEGISRVIQVSALGADPASSWTYMRTKGEAEVALKRTQLDWSIIEPSVVYGHDGESATMFRRLAQLPIWPVPGRGEAMLQPVHIDDICAAIVAMLEGKANRQVIHAVGPEAMTYRDMLAYYRSPRHAHAAWVMPMPWALMQVMAQVTQWLPSSLLEPDTLEMLRAGSVADSSEFECLLGRPLRHPSTFCQ